MSMPLKNIRPLVLSMAQSSTSDGVQNSQDVFSFVEENEASREELAGGLAMEAVDMCQSYEAHSAVLNVLIRSLSIQCAEDASGKDKKKTLTQACVGLARSVSGVIHSEQLNVLLQSFQAKRAEDVSGDEKGKIPFRTCVGLARSVSHSLIRSIIAKNQGCDLDCGFGSGESFSLLNDATGMLFTEFRSSKTSEHAIKVLIEVLLEVAKERQESDVSRFYYAPAMAFAIYFLENDITLDPRNVATWRKNVIELLTNHLFSAGGDVSTAPPFEVQLCAPILCSLTQIEFDKVIARSLQFKLLSHPESTMVTTVAMVQILIESNGAGVRRVDFFNHFENGANLVPAGIRHLCSPNQKSRMLGIDLLLYLLIASASHQSGAVMHSSAKIIVNHLGSTLQSQGSIFLSRADQYEYIFITLDKLGQTWLDLILKLGDENITLASDDEQDLSSFVINFINEVGVAHDSEQARKAAASALDSWENVRRRSTYPSGNSTSKNNSSGRDSNLELLEQLACCKTMSKDDKLASKMAMSQPGALSIREAPKANDPVNQKLQAIGMGTNVAAPAHNGEEKEELEEESTDHRDPSTRVIASMGIAPIPNEPVVIEDYGESPEAELAVATAVPSNEGIIGDAIEYDPTTKPSLMQNRRFLTYGIGVFLLIVLIAMGSTFLGLTTSNPDPVPEWQQTPIIPPTSESEMALLAVLEDVSGVELTKKGTPQYQARKWIAHDDPRKLSYDNPFLVQRYILALIYFATGGDDWQKCSRDKSSTPCKYRCYTDFHCQFDKQCNATTGQCLGVPYLSGEFECDWGGVVCTDDGVVREIELGDNNLHGEQLPHEISKLTYLRRISIGYNQVKGTIPESFGDLQYVADLKLNHNGLTGTVPEEIFNLTNLQKIELNANFLEGTISSQWGTMQSLNGLWIWNNSFTGSLPEELGSLNFLSYFGIYRNKLTGTLPTSIGKLTNMKEFYVNNNFFSGSIPAGIGNWPNVESIRSNHNNLYGTLPSELFSLTNLTSLDVGFNDLTGTLSSRMGELAMLETLALRSNKFSGSLPAEMSKLVNIKMLLLHWNNFSGTVPESVCMIAPNFTVFETDCRESSGKVAIECDEDCCTGCCDHIIPRTCYST